MSKLSRQQYVGHYYNRSIIYVLGREVDIFAREALFKNGWNFRHGTGHGIGSYLYIHEG